ncbi:MAG: nucleotidyltransferase domain-containing protein [Saprospiraceae bacterium]|nr:nucleotidyltransferase domain-containing protein [Saprospiraceae bacterium]
MNEINTHIDHIKKLCVSNKVKTLFAFGSVTTDKFNIDSDIDLVVDIDESDPINYSDYYFSLKLQLENLFRRLNISNYPCGSYFIHVQNRFVNKTKKFVKI